MPIKILFLLLATAFLLFVMPGGTATASLLGGSASIPSCPPYRLTAPPAGVGREVIGIDVSASTRGGELASLYEAAADGAIDTAEREHLAVLVEAFTDASSSAHLIYADSFSSSTGSDLLDLASANRVRCQAYRAVHDLLFQSRTARATGTDVAGNLAELVARAREATIAGKPADVLALTDGLTAPAPRHSAGHDLIDLRRLIHSGERPPAIYRQHRSAFAIGDAKGMDVAIKGIDRQWSGSLASSSDADALTQLWTRACKDAHAKSCNVTEEVP